MAIYRLCMKNGTVGKGLSHAEYIFREGRYSKRSMKEELIYKESRNMPKWAVGAELSFWENADLYERLNGRSYREFEISLPNELDRDNQIKLIQDFVDREIGGNHPYSFAIHEKSKNGIKNTHCHFMFTERKLDGIERTPEQFFKRGNSKNPILGGTRKDESWKKRERLLEIRKNWELIVNEYLERAGLEERVDCRSLKDQREEALKNGELSKVEKLDRVPINISGKILSKPENALNSYEKTKIKEFKQIIEIKNLKEEQYKKEIYGELSKQELIKKLDKISRNSRKESIEKQVLNFLSKGEFYSLLLNIRNIEKDIKDNGGNEYLKEKSNGLKKSIEEIKRLYRETDEYKKQYSILEKSYENQKKKYMKELQEKYSYEYFKERPIKKIETDNILDLRYSKKNRISLEVKNTELVSLLKDEKALKVEAINILTNYEFNKIIHQQLRYKSELKRINNNVSVSKMIRKDIKDLEDQKRKISSKIDNLDKRYGEIIERFEDREDTKILAEKIEKLKKSKEKELLICEKYLKEKSEKIEPLRSCIEIRVEIEKVKRYIKFYGEQSEIDVSRTNNKRLYENMNKLENLENYSKHLEEQVKVLGKSKIREETEKTIKEQNSKIELLNKGLLILQNSTEKLDKMVDRKQNSQYIQKLALNFLSSGLYMKLNKEKNKVLDLLEGNENNLKSIGILEFRKRRELMKERDKLKFNLEKIELQEKNIRSSISTESLSSIEKALGNKLEKTKLKIQKEIESIKKDRNYENQKLSAAYEILKGNLERYRPENSLKIARNLAYTSKKLSLAIDEQKISEKNANKINLKDNEKKEEWEI